MENRNFYRDPVTGQVYEYDDQQVEAGFVLPNLVEMTPAEIEAHMNPVPTPEQVLASQSAKLVALKAEANAQKIALDNRISELNDAVEYEIITPEELIERPLRIAQRKQWGLYAIDLGRVTTQAGWPPDVVWPTKPTAGMDLTVSSVAPNSPQLQ